MDLDNRELLTGVINKLPNEILDQLFQFLPTTDVLRNCRLVCRTWTPIATSTCRKRHVKLKDLTYTMKWKLKLQHVFPRHADVPWSAVELLFDNDPYKWMSCEEFCEEYGTQVRSLHAVVRSQYNFVRALRYLPNLENLQILPSTITTVYQYESDSSLLIQSLPGIKLSKLKHLSFLSFKLVVELLEFILKNTGASLTSLRFKLYEVSSDELKKVIDLIHTARIPKISLELAYGRSMKDSLKALEYKQSVGIHDLGIRLNLNQSDIEEGDCFYQLERFLANCTELQTLRLLDFEANSAALMSNFKLLRLPAFFDLKTLNISFDWDFLGVAYSTDPGFPDFPLVNFHLLKSMDFHNLETVDLSFSGSFMMPVAIDIRRIFDTSGSTAFESVKILKIEPRNHAVGYEGTLANIFPNAIKMATIIQRMMQFRPILSGMKNLAELDLTLRSATNNNQLLLHGLEFIRRCKGLKKLTVRNDIKNNGKALDDTGLLVLQKLHPVKLIIYKAQIKKPKYCITQLEAVHRGVRLLQ